MCLPKKDRKAMIAMIENWQKSGMRQKDFYRQHNIPAHVFYYWLKCYRGQQHGKIAEPLPTSSHFVELVPSLTQPLNNIEIRLPNGIQIFCNEHVSLEYLKALTR